MEAAQWASLGRAEVVRLAEPPFGRPLPNWSASSDVPAAAPTSGYSCSPAVPCFSPAAQVNPWAICCLPWAVRRWAPVPGKLEALLQGADHLDVVELLWELEEELRERGW